MKQAHRKLPVFLQLRDGNNTVLWSTQFKLRMLLFEGVIDFGPLVTQQPQANPIQLVIYTPGIPKHEIPETILPLIEGTCPFENNPPAPGCDLVDIPEQAVVGRFVSASDAYWKPGEAVTPRTSIGAGNTAWVLGVDESGEYSKILWSCDTLWVSTNALAPNDDEVWNGTPLPTTVVE